MCVRLAVVKSDGSNSTAFPSSQSIVNLDEALFTAVNGTVAVFSLAVVASVFIVYSKILDKDELQSVISVEIIILLDEFAYDDRVVYVVELAGTHIVLVTLDALGTKL